MAAARLALTKLVIEDLAAGERFYRDVLGLRTVRRTDGPVLGKQEVVMAATDGAAGPMLILMRFVARPCPPAGSCFLGFVVPDVAATVTRARDLGAKIIMDASGPGHRFALFRDPAGHMVELIEDAVGGREGRLAASGDVR